MRAELLRAGPAGRPFRRRPPGKPPLTVPRRPCRPGNGGAGGVSKGQVLTQLSKAWVLSDRTTPQGRTIKLLTMLAQDALNVQDFDEDAVGDAIVEVEKVLLARAKAIAQEEPELASGRRVQRARSRKAG